MGREKYLIAWKFINLFLKSIYFPHEGHTQVPFFAFEYPRGVLKCQSFWGQKIKKKEREKPFFRAVKCTKLSMIFCLMECENGRKDKNLSQNFQKANTPMFKWPLL